MQWTVVGGSVRRTTVYSAPSLPAVRAVHPCHRYLHPFPFISYFIFSFAKCGRLTFLHFLFLSFLYFFSSPPVFNTSRKLFVGLKNEQIQRYCVQHGQSQDLFQGFYWLYFFTYLPLIPTHPLRQDYCKPLHVWRLKRRLLFLHNPKRFRFLSNPFFACYHVQRVFRSSFASVNKYPISQLLILVLILSLIERALGVLLKLNHSSTGHIYLGVLGQSSPY